MSQTTRPSNLLWNESRTWFARSSQIQSRIVKVEFRMKEFRTSLTIKDPKQVVLSDLPFSEGEEVEVVVVAKNGRDARVSQLKDLFKATQSLPHLQSLSEEDITREVEAYRNGR
jgi:hypothetical protein